MFKASGENQRRFLVGDMLPILALLPDCMIELPALDRTLLGVVPLPLGVGSLPREVVSLPLGLMHSDCII